MKGPRCGNILCEQQAPNSLRELPRRIFTVNQQARTLAFIPHLHLWICFNPQIQNTLEQDQDLEDCLIGIIKKIMVVEILKGTSNQSRYFFYGPISQLDFDPIRYKWPGSTSFASIFLEDRARLDAQQRCTSRSQQDKMERLPSHEHPGGLEGQLKREKGAKRDGLCLEHLA